MTDTTGVIQNAALSPADKLREYRIIAGNPITLATYRECTDESARRSRNNLLIRTLEAGTALGKQDDSDLRAIMQTLLPRCGQAVTAASARLFLKDQKLLKALLCDDANIILTDLLERLRSNQNIKKYAILEIIQALAVNNPLLCQMDDATFLKKYGEIYQKVWNGDYLNALEEMTGLFMEGRVDGGQEAFLTLFVSLAAVEEQVPAFLFGKLQLAWLYHRQNRQEECRAVVEELTEMGLDSQDLSELRQMLK